MEHLLLSTEDLKHTAQKKRFTAEFFQLKTMGRENLYALLFENFACLS